KGDTRADTPQEGEGKDEKHGFGQERQDPGKAKPDSKDGSTTAKTGPTDRPEPTEKGTAHNPPKKPDPTDPKANDQRAPGDVKHAKDTTASDTKHGSGEKGGMEDTPPADAGGTKPKEGPAAGEKRDTKKDQTTDAGGTRGGPMENDPAGGTHPEKKSDGAREE